MGIMNRKLSTKKAPAKVAEHPHSSGFSLFELLVSMTVLSVLLGFLLAALTAISSLYVHNDDTTRAEEKGRAVIELMTREVTPAVIDTRMQFVMLPGEELTDVGALNVVTNSPAMLWMAPLGPGGELRCIGYFLTADTDKNHYRLKRIYIKHNNPYNYFPNLVNLDENVDIKKSRLRDLESRTSPVDADWFLENWDATAFDDISANNEQVMISTVSDGVVAFWIQPLDTQGNPIPRLSLSTNHPANSLIYNSAAYFYMADETSFDDGSTFVYLKKNRLTMKANRLPAAIELAIVMISEDNLNNGVAIPVQEDVLTEAAALDLDTSIQQYTKTLESAGYTAPRIFRTTVKLTNGG